MRPKKRLIKFKNKPQDRPLNQVLDEIIFDESDDIKLPADTEIQMRLFKVQPIENFSSNNQFATPRSTLSATSQIKMLNSIKEKEQNYRLT